MNINRNNKFNIYNKKNTKIFFKKDKVCVIKQKKF
jgi:hypothetical protein